MKQRFTCFYSLQATPLDEYAFRINGMIDDVIGLLMKKLNLQIPPFRLVRRCSIKRVTAPEEESKKGLLSFLKSTKSEEKESLMVITCSCLILIFQKTDQRR